MKGIFLLLGSNLGNRSETLQKARDLINNEIGRIVNQSSIYSTKAWGVENQPDFLNQVIELDSALEPHAILREVNKIEERLGRVRYVKWHSRIIDIDLLYYGQLVLNSEDLVIPHKEIENRKFVLIPMNEIASSLIHPKSFVSQKELLLKCTDKLDVQKYEPLE